MTHRIEEETADSELVLGLRTVGHAVTEAVQRDAGPLSARVVGGTEKLLLPARRPRTGRVCGQGQGLGQTEWLANEAE